MVFEELVDALPAVGGKRGRPRRWPEKLHADKGYDYPRCRAHLKRRGIQDRIARKGIERNDRLGRHRWVVERTHAWLAAFGKLRQLLLPYLALVLTGLVALAGVAGIVEMTYHLQFSGSTGDDLALLGVPLQTNAVSSWLGAGALLLFGGGAFEWSRRRFAKSWSAVQVDIQNQINRKGAP